MSIEPRQRRRSGSVLVLALLMMVVMFGFLAFAVDLGYLNVLRTQVQRSADAAAVAAAWELIDEDTLTGAGNPEQLISDAGDTAAQYAQLNTVAGKASALAAEDIVIGHLANPSDPDSQITFDEPSRYNAVQIRVQRSADQNGEVPLFFARVLGIDSHSTQGWATAAFVNSFSGFRAPTSGENLQMLPFALDQETWNALMAGTGTDDWSWDAESGQVVAGSDGILEVNLYPQGTGSPGNRGTVDIGSDNNSTADLARQILYGISEEDLEYHGGSLEFDANGELHLGADPGISAGMKDELAAIKGDPRIIPIFSQLTGNGNNAQYTIVQFAGIRITDVKLTGSMSSKRVIIQPAIVLAGGGIPGPPGDPTSNFVYSAVWLVR